MAFASTEELRVELGLSTLTADQTARAQRRLDAATAAIQDYTGQTISRVDADEVTLVGTWAAKLPLPEVPVVSVTAVSVEGEALTADSDYFLSGRILWRGAVGLNDEQAWRVPTPADSHWGGPERTVTVTYTHGWEEIPDAIREVCLNMALRGWDTPTGAVSEKVGSWSAQYGPEASSGAVGLTRAEKAILRRLKRTWQAW
jgi:hypothetical protein